MADAYAAKHAAAYKKVAAKGRAVRFIGAGVATIDKLTDRSTPSTAFIQGVAVDLQPDLKQYEALGLIASRSRTMLFVAQTFGEKPEMAMTVRLADGTYTVKSTTPIGPDDRVIITFVTVSQ